MLNEKKIMFATKTSEVSHGLLATGYRLLNERRTNMLKHTIMFAAVAGLVLALAPAAQAELVGYWNFDNSSDRYEESSGWAQSAAGGSKAAGYYDAENATGTPAWGSTGGIIGTYLDLSDAEDDSLRVKNTNNVTEPFHRGAHGSSIYPMTLSVWVYGWAADYNDVFVAKGSGNGGYRMVRKDADDARFVNRDGYADGDGSLGDDAWHHLVGIYDDDANLNRLYVDGKASGTASPGSFWGRNSYVTFGAMDGGGNVSNVMLDDIGFWDDYISPKEVAAIHAMGLFEAIGLDDAEDRQPDRRLRRNRIGDDQRPPLGAHGPVGAVNRYGATRAEPPASTPGSSWTLPATACKSPSRRRWFC